MCVYSVCECVWVLCECVYIVYVNVCGFCVNPGESYDPLLMSLVKFTSISVDEGEETG